MLSSEEIHGINNVLSSTYLALEILSSELEDKLDKEGKKYFKVILLDVKKIQKIVNS